MAHTTTTQTNDNHSLGDHKLTIDTNFDATDEEEDSPSGDPYGKGGPRMGRKKIKIEKINDSKNRQVTFNKRKVGLLKKAIELSVLCDCDVSLLIFHSGKLYEYSSKPLAKLIQKYIEYDGNCEVLDNTDLQNLRPGKASSIRLARKVKYDSFESFRTAQESNTHLSLPTPMRRSSTHSDRSNEQHTSPQSVRKDSFQTHNSTHSSTENESHKAEQRKRKTVESDIVQKRIKRSTPSVDESPMSAQTRSLEKVGSSTMTSPAPPVTTSSASVSVPAVKTSPGLSHAKDPGQIGTRDHLPTNASSSVVGPLTFVGTGPQFHQDQYPSHMSNAASVSGPQFFVSNRPTPLSSFPITGDTNGVQVPVYFQAPHGDQSFNQGVPLGFYPNQTHMFFNSSIPQTSHFVSASIPDYNNAQRIFQQGTQTNSVQMSAQEYQMSAAAKPSSSSQPHSAPMLISSTVYQVTPSSASSQAPSWNSNNNPPSS